MSVLARLFAGCAVLVVLAVFTVGIIAYGIFRFSEAEPIRGAWSAPLDGASSVTAQVEVAHGDVTIADGLPAGPVVGADTALATEYVVGSNTPITHNWRLMNGAGTATLGSESADPPVIFLRWLQSPKRAAWNVGLNPTVPVDLTVNVALGSARLDLSELSLSGLDLNLAIGSADIIVGAGNGTTGRIRVGVGDVNLAVPEDVPVSIRVNAGAGGVQAGAGFLDDGMTYTNAAWRDRTNPDTGIELVVETGTGNIILTTLSDVTGPASPSPSSPLPSRDPAAISFPFPDDRPPDPLPPAPR